MDKKAQITIGSILVVFVAVLIGIALYIGTQQLLAPSISTIVYNTSAGSDSITCPANGVTIDLTGQELIGTPVVNNETGVVVAANYTIDEGVSTITGVKTIRYKANTAEFAGATLNLTYTYGPDGYIESSGGRALASLIAVFAALAIAMVALEPTLRSGVLNMMGR